MYPKPSKDVRFSIFINWWVNPGFLVAIQPYHTQTTPNGVLLQAKVAGANETLQAHTYGEVRALDNKKNRGWLDLDRWTVVKFFFSFGSWKQGGDSSWVFFFSRPKTSSPWSLQFFYLYGLRRWKNPWSCLFTGEFFIFHPKNPISSLQKHSVIYHEGGSNRGILRAKDMIAKTFWGIILSCRPDLILLAILSQILGFFWTTRSFVMGGR